MPGMATLKSSITHRLHLASVLNACPERRARLSTLDPHDTRPAVRLVGPDVIFTPDGLPLDPATATRVREILGHLGRDDAPAADIAATGHAQLTLRTQRLRARPCPEPLASPAIVQLLKLRSRRALRSAGLRHWATGALWWDASLLDWNPQRALWLFACRRAQPGDRSEVEVVTFLSGWEHGRVWAMTCHPASTTIDDALAGLAARP